jgi:predicted lactoylglutathione lyase
MNIVIRSLYYDINFKRRYLCLIRHKHIIEYIEVKQLAGIVFLKSNDLEKTKNFYKDIIGADIWLDQQDCVIFKHDNFLFGFCVRDDIHRDWLLTFFYRTQDEVDEIYEKVKDLAITKPIKNEKYNIYQFYAHDPEGRDLEFQAFLHEIDFNWDLY